jgi:hypothetical protein
VPKEVDFPIFHLWNGKIFEAGKKLQYVWPPKGAIFYVRRELSIVLVFLPNQFNPRCVMPVEELVEILVKRGLILFFKVYDP